jgi:murein DD-endopeptidase MepM/ murein hydrolase activator NlpD
MQRIAIIVGLIGLFQFKFINTFSQALHIESPLNIPLYLSGNFGELRSTHFHAGIDIKTQGVTGKPVFAIQKGYISRIKVQTGGYGHSIYIMHDNGYTSVYGHLQEYYPELEAYLKNEQYRLKSFEVDLFPEKNLFEVEAGQQIAVSGNSGSSGGPHLHFEIRNSKQVPLNGLTFNLPIKDTIPPKFVKLAVYNSFDETTYTSNEKSFYTVEGSKGDYKIKEALPISNTCTFGVEVYDFLNGSNNKCGVYKLDFFIDDTLIYSFTIDKISFSETKYIKSHLDYAEKVLNKRNVHKLFLEPYNKLGIYNEIKNRGIVSISDTLYHNARILAADVYGNASKLTFKFYNKGESNIVPRDTGNFFVPYNEGINYTNDVFSIKIPPYGLYSSKWLGYFILPSDNNYYSDIHFIGDELIAVNKYPELTLKATKGLNNIPTDKLVIAKINDSGELSSEGGSWNSGSVTASVSGFGKYVIVADTLPPEIKKLSFKNEAWYASNDIISFKISDNLSGIKTYNGYIDDQWVLFEYDSKNELLFYRIDAHRLVRSKSKHKLNIFVLDDRNNLQKFESSFYY